VRGPALPRTALGHAVGLAGRADEADDLAGAFEASLFAGMFEHLVERLREPPLRHRLALGGVLASQRAAASVARDAGLEACRDPVAAEAAERSRHGPERSASTGPDKCMGKFAYPVWPGAPRVDP
jgi:hypothetical protein